MWSSLDRCWTTSRRRGHGPNGGDPIGWRLHSVWREVVTVGGIVARESKVLRESLVQVIIVRLERGEERRGEMIRGEETL